MKKIQSSRADVVLGFVQGTRTCRCSERCVMRGCHRQKLPVISFGIGENVDLAARSVWTLSGDYLAWSYF